MNLLKHSIHIKVNGITHDLLVAAGETLLDVLRDRLGLTGTKKGCGTGDCGACTVIMEGKTVNSCLVLAVEAAGKEILTIEGLASGSELHPLQQAFIEYGAVQCGYCMPGMILSAKALLDENHNPTEEDIRKGIAGNLCRCTGYVKIVKVIKAVTEVAKANS